VPCHVLLTKADKLKRGPAQATLLQVRRSLPPSASVQVYSAKSRDGLVELIRKLDLWYEIEAPSSQVRPGSIQQPKTS